LLYPNGERILKEKIAFAKHPVTEKTKFQIHREVKVKRSRYGVGVALLCG
jgi:polyisoprenoid-binding protein YceI